jgi:uncharacterized protein
MSLDVQPPQPTNEELGFEETFLDSESVTDAVPAGDEEVSVAEVRGAEPVTAAERLTSVDVLRGFALLGILAMNITAFSWPDPAYDNPLRGAGFTGSDRAVWIFHHLFFEAKMMTIFSMLFGAGLVLMDERAVARGVSLRGVYYRRIFWLLVIGAIHAYLIWSGDILFLYAECGLILFLFRKKSPKTLIIVGVTLLLLIIPLVLGFGVAINVMKAITARVDAQVRAGETPSRFDRRIHDIWTKNLQKEFKPNEEQRRKNWNEEMEAYRGGYAGIVKQRAFELLMAHTVGFILGGFFFAGSRMLLGMGLMKLGVFSAERSRSFYIWMVALGYGIGVPLMVFDAAEMIRHEFKSEYLLHGGIFYNVFGSLVVALGHVGMLMLIVQSGVLTWLTNRLAAVGRMALSNYLTHSIVCTTLFYGYGFNLFGQINRTGLACIVLCIWLFQLWISPIWLKHFRFGPAEWVWGSLTYWKRQPMRRSESALPAAVG